MEANRIMLLHDYLVRSAKRFPEKDVLLQGEKKSTYGEVLSLSENIANWLLHIGLNRGDRVAIITDDPFEYVESYFGILMAGGVVVALSNQTSARTLKYQLNHCEVSIVLTHRKLTKYLSDISDSIPTVKFIAISKWNKGLLEKTPFMCLDYNEVRSWSGRSHSLPTTSPTDLAQVIYTSGTTGHPNAVMLSHLNLSANTESIIEYLALTERDRVMAVLPFFYSYGNSLLLTHIAAGGSLVINQSFLYPNVILDEMEKKEATGFSGVPSTFAILLNHSTIRNHKFKRLRYITQAGGAMAPKLAHELKTIMPRVNVFIMYGQTEASARLSYLPPDKLFSKAGSIGKAIPGVTLTVLNPEGEPVKQGETGEIVAKGDNIMQGYWAEPEKTADVLTDKGLWTGDLARIDKDGYLYIVSRRSDIIKSGAHRISPKEIEELILEHDTIHEVAVTGVDDEVLVEAIKAYIVLKPGARCTKKELLGHCHKHLPHYKVPHHIEFMEKLPRTASGKVRKNILKSNANPTELGAK